MMTFTILTESGDLEMKVKLSPIDFGEATYKYHWRLNIT